MPSKSNNQSGFGLIELLVAFGILSILLYGFQQYFALFYRNQNRAENKNSLLSLRETVREVLSMEEGCKCNFQGLEFDAEPTGLLQRKVSLSSFALFSTGCGAKGPNLVEVGKAATDASSKVAVQSIGIENFFAVRSDLYSVDLIVRFGEGYSPLRYSNVLLTTQDVSGTNKRVSACFGTRDLSSQGFNNFQVFDNNSTFAVPEGTKKVMVEAWGGGGGGGACHKFMGLNQAAGGGGGGAGGYGKGIFSVVPGQTYSIAVGDGGNAMNDADGTQGGDTTFGALLVSRGGEGGKTGKIQAGVPSTGLPGSGGTVVLADGETISGGFGTAGEYNYSSTLGASGGMGGTAPKGGGHTLRPGGGGAGGGCYFVQAQSQGANGGGGRVIVWW